MSILYNDTSKVGTPRTYWERPGKRQTRNSQRWQCRTRPTHISKCRKRGKIVYKCPTRLPTLPNEIWLLVLQAMRPRDLHAIMQVNNLWYSEANKILRNKITTLLQGKVLYTFFRSGLGGELFACLDQYALPPTFEARKFVLFYDNYDGALVSVSSILEKEGFDGFPEGVWRDSGRFLRACLTSPGCQLYCSRLSRLCTSCNPEFIWPGRRKVKVRKGEKLVHTAEDGRIFW
jgi:hypothetical protein